MRVRDEEKIEARDNKGGFLIDILKKDTMIEKINIMGYTCDFFFEKRRLEEFLYWNFFLEII